MADPQADAPAQPPAPPAPAPAPPPMAASPMPRAAAPAQPLYRVVEVVRNDQGRLERLGQIWQPDLDRARRFGRVLAANSFSDKVLVANTEGAVLETIPEPSADAPPMGWGDWRDLPLPPRPRAPGERLWRKPAAPSVPVLPVVGAPLPTGMAALATASPEAVPPSAAAASGAGTPGAASPFDTRLGDPADDAQDTRPSYLDEPPPSIVERTATLPPGAGVGA